MTTVKESLGLIGVGAFGGFAVPYLALHFDVVVYDTKKECVDLLEKKCPVKVGDLRQAASCDIVILAVPVQKLETVLREIAPIIRPGTLVMDVASVKVKPAQLMQDILPAHADIVGVHPLFGPQSGKNGIEGLNVAVCNIRGQRGDGVGRFLADTLKLNVLRATPEEHDRELAYIQGLTHLLARVIVSLDLPEFRFTTKAYDHMQKMVDMVRHDSDELFLAIAKENPFSGGAKKAFFEAAYKLEDKLGRD